MTIKEEEKMMNNKMMMKKKKILVTGGAGFLGSHMVDALLSAHGDAVEVSVVDNLQTGSESNLSHLVGSDKRVRLFRVDVIDLTEEMARSSSDVRQVLDTPFDQIYHMACAASPPHYQRDPVHTLRTCFEGTHNILRIAQRHGSRVLFTGTSEVYGDPLVSPQPEGYWGNVNCVGVRSCYDEGKRVAESLLVAFHHMHGTEVRMARIFNTYGPRMNFEDGRIISNFVFQSLNSDPVTVYGDGTQTRSFCYVSDQIAGLMALMDQDETIGPVNIGNPDEYTVLEMAQTIRKIVGETDGNRIVYMDLPSDDPKQRRPDISRAKAVMGWEPRVSLTEGLAHTIADFRERLPEWLEQQERRSKKQGQEQKE